MLTNNLGYPRIGNNRELKKTCEQYWSDKTSNKNLLQVGQNIRQENWQMQKVAGIDLIPSNDFPFTIKYWICPSQLEQFPNATTK